MKKFLYLLIILFLMQAKNGFSGSAIAGSEASLSIDDIALIAIGSDVSIVLDTIQEAGQTFSAKSIDSSFSLTSTVGSNKERSIQVKVNKVLTKLDLRLTISDSSTPSSLISGEKILSTSYQTIATGITNIATTSGQLQYELIPTVTAGETVPSQNEAIQVTYTLTDDF